MKTFKLTLSELLELQLALAAVSENDKIPISHIMSFSEIKQEIKPKLKSYAEAKNILVKRLSEKVTDGDGKEVEQVTDENMEEFNAENKKLVDKEYEVKLPTFTMIDLGHDAKKPTVNKYNISAGAIMGLGRLVTRK